MSRRPIQPVLALLVLAVGLVAQTNSEPVRDFYRARDLCDRQDYPAAIAAYEQALAGGEASPELLFNLGTTCLFADENGKGLYYLLLAQRLAPWNEDVAHNVAAARKRAVDDIPRPEHNPLVARILILHERTTPRLAFVLFTGFFVIGFALLHLGVLGRQRWWSRIGILLVVVGLSFAVSAWQRRDDPRDAGVILAAKASVFSGMAEEKHLLYFELHAGAEVEVLEEQDGWVKIAVGDKKGYLRREAIGIL
ncbi:MAG: hypothetical protein H6807_16400 [Planctomycetes bacterium]|nr:hypothetical protein [Planctomycetota bacterium]